MPSHFLANFLTKFSKQNKSLKKSSSKSYYIVDDSDDKFTIKESYKTARTNIIFSLANEVGCKKIVVTSSWPGEGKTTTSVNLSVTFAQAGMKVLLLDADLRKPSVARVLGIKKEEGITSVIGGFSDLNEVIVKTKYPNLDVIVTGPKPPNPAELMASQRFGEIIGELSQNYDYIFIDTPPVNVVTDASAVSKYSTGVILVVKHLGTNHRSISEALGKLKFSHVRIVGFVLNDIHKDSFQYKCRYRYNYFYKHRKYKYYSKQYKE